MSLILRLPNTTIAGAPHLYRDRVLNAGSLYLFDALSTYCNSNTKGVNLPNPSVMKNLMDAGADLSTAGAAVLNDPTGIILDAFFEVISMPDAAYDMSVLQHDFLAIVWYQQKTATYSTVPYQCLFGRAKTATVPQFLFDTGADGKTIRVSVGVGGAQKILAGNIGSPALDAPHQVALAWQGGVLTAYLDGVQKGAGLAAAGVLDAAAAGVIDGCGSNSTTVGVSYANFKGTIYRAYKEDLSVSGANAAAQVAADYAANNGRFV